MMLFSHFPRIIGLLGLNTALAWGLASQLLRLLTGPISAFLIIKHLSPTNQGIYYTIAAISGLQILFESGMGQSILKATSSRFSGDGKLLSLTRKLQDIDQKNIAAVFVYAVHFFSRTALVFLLISGLVCYGMFNDLLHNNPVLVAACALAMLGTGLSIVLISVSSILEGIQQIDTIFRARLAALTTQFVTMVVCLVSGVGILTIGIVAIVGPLTCFYSINKQWPYFLRSLWQSELAHSLNWKLDIWPFQQRMLINSLCAYAAWSFATPLIFKMVNPVAAGQYALNWNILFSISGLAATWTYSKLGFFGQLIMQGEHEQVSRQVFTSTIQGLFLYIVLSVAYVVFILVLGTVAPDYAVRFGSMSLIITIAFNNLLGTFFFMRSHYMHAYGVDGFVPMTVATTLIAVCLQIYLAPAYGAFGVALGALLPACLMAILAPWLLRRTIAQRIFCLSSTPAILPQRNS